MSEASAPAVLVIGGGSGIGEAAAREFAQHGYRVAVMSPSESALEVADATGGVGVTGSNGSEADLGRAVDTVLARFSRIDVVVNSAGHAARKPVLEISDEEWLAGMDMYLLSVIRLTRLVTPLFVKQGHGSIVNVSTSSPFEPNAKFPVSATMRAGLAAFTKLYTDQYGPAGVRMNNVLPGYTTPSWASVPTEWTEHIPLRRAADPSEIAKTIRFLASDEASYITGQNVRVDGGSSRSV